MKVVTAKVGTQKQNEKTHPEIAATQIETVDTGISTGSREKEQQEEKLPEILAREAVAVLAALSTPPKQKGKRKRKTCMYFKARRSTQIKVGRPQPQSKVPIVIEDTTPKPKEESPTNMSITYERGSPKTSTWREKIRLVDSKTALQEAETSLQETLAKLRETEKLEEKVAKPS